MPEKTPLHVINARRARTTLVDDLLPELRVRLETFGTAAERVETLRRQFNEARRNFTGTAPSQDEVDEANNLVQEYFDTRAATRTADSEIRLIQDEDDFTPEVKAMLVKSYLPAQKAVLEAVRADFDRVAPILVRHDLACEITALQENVEQAEAQARQPRQDVIEILDEIQETVATMRAGGLTPTSDATAEIKAAQQRVQWTAPSRAPQAPRPTLSGQPTSLLPGSGGATQGSVATTGPNPVVGPDPLTGGSGQA